MEDPDMMSQGSESRRSKRLTASQRLGVIMLVENNVLRADEVAHLYGITKPAVQYILKNRDKIKARVVSVDNPSTIGRYPELENHVYQQVVANVPAGDVASITNHDIKDTAIEYARVNGLEGFRASTTWIENFKVRYNVGTLTGTTPEQMAAINANIGPQYMSYPVPVGMYVPSLPTSADHLYMQFQQVQSMGSTSGVMPMPEGMVVTRKSSSSSKPRKRRQKKKKKRTDDDDDEDLDDEYGLSNEDD